MKTENEKTSIKQILQGMAGKNVEVLQGTVLSGSPLSIQAAGDEKLQIGPGNVYVPRHLTDYITKCEIAKGAKGSVDGPANDGSRLTDFVFCGDIIIKNALQPGEAVHVLSFNHGKQYYVLDRVD